jgi:hypothetical protein
MVNHAEAAECSYGLINSGFNNYYSYYRVTTSCTISQSQSFSYNLYFQNRITVTIVPNTNTCEYPTITAQGKIDINKDVTIVTQPLPLSCSSTPTTSDGAPGGSFWSYGGRGAGKAPLAPLLDSGSTRGGVPGAGDKDGNNGGRGGGIATFVAVTRTHINNGQTYTFEGIINVDGLLSANGEDAASTSSAGGGSGGTILLTAEVSVTSDRSSGVVQANGGYGGEGTFKGGPGSGGEIIIDAPSVSSSLNVEAFGGLAKRLTDLRAIGQVGTAVDRGSYADVSMSNGPFLVAGVWTTGSTSVSVYTIEF